MNEHSGRRDAAASHEAGTGTVPGTEVGAAPDAEIRDATPGERWRPRSLREGTDPDPRFTLANERTLLAWLRTSMALIAGAVALEAFVSDAIPRAVRMPLAIVLLVIAAALAIYSFRRWLRMESAMRQRRPLPAPAGALILVAGVGAAALALVIGILWNA